MQSGNFVWRKGVDFAKKVTRGLGIEIKRAQKEAPDAGEHEALTPVNTLALTISDVLLRMVLHGGKTQDFTFVQIGANDGVSNDPIRRYVVKYGFKGVLIEPQPDVFKRLKANYDGMPGITFENAAIAAQDGKIEMYRFKKDSGVPHWADGLASFSKETVIRNFQNIKGEVETIIVPTISFGSLLRKHNISHLDLLQVDAEGYDYEILKMIDFNAIKPEIIHFEHGFLSPQQQNECFSYLQSKGYKVYNNADNTVAYREPDEQSHLHHIEEWRAESKRMSESV